MEGVYQYICKLANTLNWYSLDLLKEIMKAYTLNSHFVVIQQNFAELYFSYISSWEPFDTDTYKKQVQNLHNIAFKRTHYYNYNSKT